MLMTESADQEIGALNREKRENTFAITQTRS